MASQGKCDVHGIWLDINGRCHFCETSNPQNRAGQGVKTLGGGPQTGVKTYAKGQTNEAKQAAEKTGPAS